MSNLKTALLSLAFITAFSTLLNAQLFIDTSYTVDEMVMDFFDNTCVSPSNISYTGAAGTYAFFDAGDTDLDVPAGIYLGTGFAYGAIGPNDGSGHTGVTGGEGDLDLQTLSGSFFTSDAAIIEMDIVATGSELNFSYIFASEEYPEFVNSGFNDIFAFFISGPGINGQANIAMVPNSNDPVSINTINDQLNSAFYVDNTDGIDLQFDGFTTELTASVSVMPNETYHVKIAITDVGDAAFDSGIFLGIESLCGDSLLIPPAKFTYTMDDLELNFQNNSRYATSYFWDFGDNNTSTEKNPGTHVYQTDGIYEVTLITQNYCCSDTLTTEVIVGNPTANQKVIDRPYALFPNPAGQQLAIIFQEGQSYLFNIRDMQGQIVMQNKGTSKQNWDLSALPNGIYLIEIESSGVFYQEKLIKQ